MVANIFDNTQQCEQIVNDCPFKEASSSSLRLPVEVYFLTKHKTKTITRRVFNQPACFERLLA